MWNYLFTDFQGTSRTQVILREALLWILWITDKKLHRPVELTELKFDWSLICYCMNERPLVVNLCKAEYSGKKGCVNRVTFIPTISWILQYMVRSASQSLSVKCALLVCNFSTFWQRIFNFMSNQNSPRFVAFFGVSKLIIFSYLSPRFFAKSFHHVFFFAIDFSYISSKYLNRIFTNINQIEKKSWMARIVIRLIQVEYLFKQ